MAVTKVTRYIPLTDGSGSYLQNVFRAPSVNEHLTRKSLRAFPSDAFSSRFSQSDVFIQPPPTALEEFLPWASNHYKLPIRLVCCRKHDATTGKDLKPKSKLNLKSKKSGLSLLEHGRFDSKSNITVLSLVDPNELLIYTIHDAKDAVVELEFPTPKIIPRKLMKLIHLILSFHPSLNKITIHKKAVDRFVLHELKHLLSASFITELCLDNNAVRERNWYDLLVGFNQLKSLSLARCRIDDIALKLMMKMLTYDQPAGKTLMMLNLTTNFITDVGAKSISDVLRSNRTLRYLNLADNQITDVGAGYLLEPLKKFILTDDETYWKRRRRLDYALLFASYYEKSLAKVTAEGLKSTEDAGSRTSGKKAKGKPVFVAAKTQKRRDLASTITLAKKNTSIHAATNTIDHDTISLANSMALDLLGPDPEPFGYDDTECQFGYFSSLGNMTLTYLNLAYNKIEFPTIWAILNVFFYHAHRRRANQFGLMKVIVEGNLLPNICDEFAALEEIMDKTIIDTTKTRSFASLKKRQTKSEPMI